MYKTILVFASHVVSVYALLCFIRILITWIPSIGYTTFGRFLAKITDPFLNCFRGIKWLRLGSFDFSPAVGLCLLGLVSFILSTLAATSKITVGLILSIVIGLLWNIVSSILIFIIILMIVRLIIILVQKTEYGTGIFEYIDQSLLPLLGNITRIFTQGRRTTYKTKLIVGSLALFAVLVIGSILFNTLSGLLMSLPF